MPGDRIKLYRSKPSVVPVPEALGITSLTIDLCCSQHFPIAIEMCVDALNVLGRCMHGQSSPSSSKDEGLRHVDDK